MKKLLCWAVYGLCVSCTFLDKDSDPSIDATGNPITYYYNRSLDSTLSLEEQRQAIDSSLHMVNTQDPHPIYSMILYQKCLLSYRLREYDSLFIYDKLLTKHAKRTKDVQTLAGQHYLMGNYFERVAVPDSAFNRYNLSKSYHLELKDSSGVARGLLRMGIIQKDQSDFFGSKETLTEALPFLKMQKNDGELAQAYNLLATDHRKLFDFKEAVKYFQLAIEKAGSIKEKLGFENNLAASYIDDKKYGDATKILQRIILDSSLEKNSSQYARVLDNLAYAKWLSGKEKMVEPFINALKIRIENKDERGQIASYTHLGEFHSQNRPREALAYFDTVIRLSKTIKMPKAEADALKFMMPLEPANVQIRNRYIFLQDSLYAQELNVKTQFAHYKYRNKEIQEKSLRLEMENAEKELELTRQRNQKVLSFFGTALLLLTLGFVFYYLKQRTRRLAQENKTAKLEATLETEAEMSSRLHDDFGAKLNQAMSMVVHDTDKDKVLDTLEGLYNQSRNFSREINEVDTGSHFKDAFFEMLRYRTPENANLVTVGSKEIDWDTVSPLSKKVLHKVVQELMINMERHSKATLITIEFKKTGKRLEVEYVDDGVGASQQDLNARNGLRNTEKRIQAVGGTITFDSGKGEGFKAHFSIPY